MGYRALCLLLLGLLARSTYGQTCTLITSNVLRVDSMETFVVDGHGTALDGDIIIQDFPKKNFVISQGKISVNSSNGFLGTSKFMVPSINLDKDPDKKQFVYVIVRSGPCNLERVVLVSFQRGYIFLQTDKPLYTPGSTVRYRLFSTTPDMNPIHKSVVVKVLTPYNAIIRQDTLQQTSMKGIISGDYKLTDLASLGTWSLVAMFEDSPLHEFTTHFEVKEYVLPSFEVKIKTDKTFFYISDQELIVDIQAKYLNGKPLDGVAYVVFSVSREITKTLQDTLQTVQIEDGEGLAVLKRKDLVKYFQNEMDMLEWRLGMSATVITDSGRDMVESKLPDIPIVTSPYKVLYVKTSKYFKPGMPMDVMVSVTNSDGSPAHRVPVVAEPGSVRGTTQEDGTVRLTINTHADITSLHITLKTEDPILLPAQQSVSSMIATAYRSRGGNFLHLSVGCERLKIGETAAINFNIRNTNSGVQNQITHFNYIILSKGRIIRAGRQERTQGQMLVTLKLLITPEVIPSFRIVAYYVVTTGAGREIVADSVWIDVADTCMGTLTISGARNRDNAVQQPGASLRLRLKADHMASVGLVVVDKGVYTMNSKEKISQSKVWDSVEKYDTGCTVGGGVDASEVFYDAGLALSNAFHGSTPQRSEFLCAEKLKRRQRDTAELINKKNNKDDKNLDFIDKTSRSEFLNSWLWTIVTMNERPENGISSKILNISVNDSLTTWEVLAVSLSEDKGICVSEPHNIQVTLPFFIDLRLPYSVVKDEQVEISAILYNNFHNKQRVRLEWSYNEQFCSLATSKSNYHQFVEVKPQSSIAVPFIIIPLTSGYHDVEVKAFGQGFSDGVKKKLMVKVTAHSVYHALEEKKIPCKNVDLSVKVKEETFAKAPKGTLSTVSLTFCTKYLMSQDSSISTVEILMMTGFEADVNDLKRLSQGIDPFVLKYEITKDTNDKSTVVLYMDKIPHSEEQCLTLRLHQYFAMGLIQPASVTVYDYYSPENRCTKFYHVDRKSQLVGKICVGEVCRCVARNEMCFMQQGLDNMTDIKRLSIACQHGLNYVYKTTLSEIKEENSYLTYMMTITRIIKKGMDSVNVNEKRNFVSQTNCREALNLEVGKDYLVLGESKDLLQYDTGLIYMVTRDTWVEWWPNSRECQKAQYSKLCDEIFNFSEELELEGCPA